MLPLTFADPADYDKIDSSDRLSILGLKELAPGTQLTIQVGCCTRIKSPPGDNGLYFVSLSRFNIVQQGQWSNRCGDLSRCSQSVDVLLIYSTAG
jgi:hypothetical protein